MSESCEHIREIKPVAPSAEGCEDCLRTGDTWVHLRAPIFRFATPFALVAVVATLMPAPMSPAAADTFRPVVRGRRGVVAGGHPLSVAAGLRILQRGGNAVDAGVATILAASVIEFSHFSFGGEVPILVKLRNQPVSVIEGMGPAPRKATREFF